MSQPRYALSNVSGVSHPFVHPQLCMAEGNMELGNVEIRDTFGVVKDVKNNRSSLRSSLPEMDEVYVIKPRIGAGIVNVDETDDRISDNPNFDETDVVSDAIITRRKKIGLSLGSGDCITLVIAEPEQGALAVVHAGWQGSALRYPELTVDQMVQDFGMKPSNAVAYLGPSIGPESYFTESLSKLQTDDPDWQPFITEVESGFKVNVPGFVIASLVRAGLESDRIYSSPVDTGTDSGFYSYRRHTLNPDNVPNGRNGFIACLT